MTSQLRCLTPVAEIRMALATRYPNLTLGFQLYDMEYWHDFIVQSLAPDPDHGDRLVCLFRGGQALSIRLPTGGDGEVTFEHPGQAALMVIGRGDNVPLEVAALEEFLRWQEEEMLLGAHDPVDDGPYAAHPRLNHLPLGVRQQLADQLTGGSTIKAIMTLRDNSRGMSLAEAAAVIHAIKISG